MKRSLAMSMLGLMMCTALPASAQEPAAGATAEASAQAAPQPDRKEADRARFSVGRFVLESLIGGALGGAAAYGAIKGICGSEICVGGALAGLGANIVVTPLGVSVVGWSMGSKGTFGSAMLGEALGVGAFSTVTTISPTAALGLGLTIAPFTSAAAFELRSNREAQTLSASLRPYTMPLISPTGVHGGTLGLAGRF